MSLNMSDDFYIQQCQAKDTKILILEKRIHDLERYNNSLSMMLYVKAEFKRNNITYVADKGLIDGFCSLYERNVALEQKSE